VIGATLTSHNGDPRQIRASVVVGADGRYSKVGEWVGAPRYSETPGLRPFYYGYFHGFEPLEEAALEMLFVDGRIGFVFPMQPGVDCLGLVLQSEDFQTFRSNPRERFMERFGQLPSMARRMSGAELDGKVQGVRAVANFFRKPYGPGWALTGDAA
jgi:flavin-dependent dehydrogenase